MIDIINPYVAYSVDHADEDVGKREKHPKFERTMQIRGRISDEAKQNLEALAKRYCGTTNICDLLEAIGMLAVRVSNANEILVDDDSGVTTEDCRQSGYEDATRRDPKYFLALFGKMQEHFGDSYVRGYMEGSYIRDKK